MYLTIDHASQFRDQFNQAGRGDQFSYEALNMLYEYLEEVDPQYELDVIALCCDYIEATPADIARDYSIEFSSVEKGDTDGERDQVIGYLSAEGVFIGSTSTSSIGYANF